VRNTFIAFALAFVCPFASTAQQIAGPSEIAAGRLGKYSVVGADGKTLLPAEFAVFPADRFDVETSASGEEAFVTGEPGEGFVNAATVIDGRPRLLTLLIRVTGSTPPGPVPPTPDPPGPTPPGPNPPTPVPVPPAFGPITHLLTLYETSKLDGREPVCDTAFTTQAKAIADYRFYDYDLPADGLPEWAALKAKALASVTPPPGQPFDKAPMVFAFDAKGNVRSVNAPVGKSVESLIAEIKGLVK
jgi:FtsP/CotA-like multicopper oxidase with cupredoxin domain